MRQPNRRMPVWKPWSAASVAGRGERRANAGAAGINCRQFFAPEGDSDNGMVAPFLKRHRGAKVDL